MSAKDLQNQLDIRLNNTEKELEIIKILLTEKNEDNFIQVLDNLKPEYFSNDYNAEIFDTCLRLFLDSKEVSQNTVSSYLELHSKPTRVSDLKSIIKKLKSINATDSIHHIIDVIKTTHVNRVVYNDVIVKANRDFMSNEPISDIIKEISSSLISIETGKKEKRLDVITKEVIDEIINPTDVTRGLKLHLKDFDQQFGGVKKDTLYVVGGEPGSGKTAFAIDIVHRLCNYHSDDVAILFFSYEMSENRITKRLVSRYTEIGNNRLSGIGVPLTSEDKEEIIHAGTMVKDYPLEIVYDTLNVEQLKNRARRFALKNPDKHLVFILDHTGLVDYKSDNIRQETIKISAACKSLCRDYEGSVFEITQLRKDLGNKDNARDYHKPDRSYIIESGSVYADCDVCLLLWRPQQRFKDIAFNGVDEWDTTDKIIVLNEKNRDGMSPTQLIMNCEVRCNKLDDLDDPFA